MKSTHPFLGISLMALAVFLIVFMNMTAKMTSEYHAPIEIVFYRSFIALCGLVSFLLITNKKQLFKTSRPKAQIARAVAGTIGLVLSFWAFSLMPMADTVAIMFTAGLMTTSMSAIILKERVGVYRWCAVFFGFIGAVILVMPSGDPMPLKGVIVALLAAFVGGALISILLRSLGKTEHALTTVFYFLFIGCLMTLPYMVFYGHLPTNITWLPLVGCGVFGLLSLVLKTQAFRYAEASLLSPIYYTGIIWASIIGWIVWKDWPTFNVFIGAGIIISSNLLITWREHQKNKSEES